MAVSGVEELQRENAELRERLDRLRKLISSVAETRTMSDLISPPMRSRMINSMSPAEIGPHLRAVALYCVRLASERRDRQLAQELEDASIELADHAGRIEAAVSEGGQ